MNLILALAASAAIVAAAQNDIPQNGDNMVVIVAQDGAYVAVDQERHVQMLDGRTSVILLVVTADGAQAGRLAVDCKARTTQIVSAYALSIKDGSVVGEAADQIEKAPGGGAKGSPSATIVEVVCGVVPSLPQSDKPAAHARGQQDTEL